MNDQNESLNKLFNELFDQLDFNDQVYILQCMNEMIPDEHAVIDIRNLKREEADPMPKKKKSTRKSSSTEKTLDDKERKKNQAVMEQIIHSMK